MYGIAKGIEPLEGAQACLSEVGLDTGKAQTLVASDQVSVGQQRDRSRGGWGERDSVTHVEWKR